MTKLHEEDLVRLSKSIADVGYWCSWTDTDSPTSLQFDFGGVKLYLPPSEGDNSPSTQLAIRLLHPSMLTFYHRNGNETDWINQLKDDEIDPLDIEDKQFSLSTNLRFPESLNSYTAVEEKFFGPDIPDIQLLFVAGDIAVRVLAQNVKLYCEQGEIALESIANLNDKWWSYWKEYWKVKDSPEAFPEDYTCEITQPGEDSGAPFQHDGA